MKRRNVGIELLLKISDDINIFMLENECNVLTVEYTGPFLPRIFRENKGV